MIGVTEEGFMIKRDAKSAAIHNRLIMAFVKYLMSNGYKVQADHIGYPNGKPEAWRHYIPDIHAKKGNVELFAEAETKDSLDSEETKFQWTALSSKPNVDFHVIVPEDLLSKAKSNAKEWNIKVKTFWSMKI